MPLKRGTTCVTCPKMEHSRLENGVGCFQLSLFSCIDGARFGSLHHVYLVCGFYMPNLSTSYSALSLHVTVHASFNTSLIVSWISLDPTSGSYPLSLFLGAQNEIYSPFHENFKECLHPSFLSISRVPPTYFDLPPSTPSRFSTFIRYLLHPHTLHPYPPIPIAHSEKPLRGTVTGKYFPCYYSCTHRIYRIVGKNVPRAGNSLTPFQCSPRKPYMEPNGRGTFEKQRMNRKIANVGGLLPTSLLS